MQPREFCNPQPAPSPADARPLEIYVAPALRALPAADPRRALLRLHAAAVTQFAAGASPEEALAAVMRTVPDTVAAVPKALLADTERLADLLAAAPSKFVM